METVPTYRAPYPVITSKPTMGQALRAYPTFSAVLTGTAAVLAGGIVSIATRPWRLKYAAGMFTFLGCATFGVMHAISDGSLRMMGLKHNQSLVAKYPYRLDSPAGTQVRVEPFRQPSQEEFEEILKNPRTL